MLPQVYAGVDATVTQIFTTGGLALLVVFAAALTLWDVSSAVRACMGALNEIFSTTERRGPLRRFAISVALAAAVVVCLAGAALLVSAAARAAADANGAVRATVGLARWTGAAVLLALAIGLVVRYAPARSPSPRWVSLGTGGIVLAWSLASTLFRWFAASIANYRTGPGILIAFLVLTSYVYVSAIIFMVGIQVDELLRREAP